MAAALRTDATHICQMDADFARSGRASDLLAATGRADLVIGSRYIHGGALRHWPAHRLMLSRFANWRARDHALRCTTAPSGFRCCAICWRACPRPHRLRRLCVSCRTGLEAKAAGGRIVEVPITFVERREGQSKMSGRVIAESVVLPWKLVARPRLKK